MTRIYCLALLFAFSFVSFVKTQDDLQSPCPRLFVYEAKGSETDKWYGIVTLLSDTDLSGIWLRLIFDRPSLQLGNWFGKVSTTDNKEYLIKNRNVGLKAHVPQTIRFFIKYNPADPPPKLMAFRLNAKTVCPEGGIAETSTAAPELQTSSQVEPVARPNPVDETLTRPDQGGGILGQRPESSEEDDFFMSELYNLFNRPAQNTMKKEPNINEICGTVVARPRPLITHGQPTNEGEYPWHVAIYHTKGIDLAYICGASLISKTFVITVAHCVTRRRSATPLNPDNLVVYLGKHYLKRFSNQGIQDRQISEIIPHPDYNAHTYSNDIALLKLGNPAEFSDYVRPVCLWQESADLNGILHKQGFETDVLFVIKDYEIKFTGSVVGWGFDETGKVTEQLMQAKMPVVSQDTCIFSFPDFYSRFTSVNTYCAGFRNGTSVCNGDSGGGMVFPTANSNHKNPVWQLRGLVSISVALQNQFKCDASHYVVFTDTAKYLNWIKNTVKI